MSEVLNLDLFEEKIKEIKAGDKSYLIPADLPTVLFFKLLNISKGGKVEDMLAGHDVLYDIFKIKQPGLPRTEFDNMMTMDKYAAVMNFIFADMSEEETKKILSEAKEQMKDGKKEPAEASV